MAEYIYDRIFAPDGAVKAIAEQYGTPFYLYHKEGILQSAQALKNAFFWSHNYQNYFTIRQNPNPHLLKLLASGGTGVNASNYSELLLAKACGFSGDELIYEPVRKDTKAENLARELDATWLINGVDLLPERLPARIILHYHPLEERLNAVQFPMIGKSKNGITKPRILDVLRDLRHRGAEKLGVSLQIASYSIKPGFWAQKAEILLSLAQEVKENLGFDLWSLHIGEGPGLPYHPRATAPTIAEEADKIHTLLLNKLCEQSYAVFTGVNRNLMEHCGLLVSKILERRDIYHTFLVLDAGFCQYIRPVLKSAYRHVSVLGRNQIENRRKYYLVGTLPDENDRPVQKGRMLPQVTPGEYCIFHDVGCGGRSMPVLYGFAPVAGEFLYEEDGTISQISPSRTEEDVMEFLTAL